MTNDSNEPQGRLNTREGVPCEHEWCSECDGALKWYTLDVTTVDGLSLHIESLACRECGHEAGGKVTEGKQP